jgi:ABC-type sugar transport system ATPase subunit
MPIRDNLVAPILRRFSGLLGFMRKGLINAFASRKIQEFSIVTPSALKKVGKLSGGNQQKCLVATWVGTDPKVIFLDEPTRGVDVASREDIYEKVGELAASGVAVVLISSDLPELIRLCGRILVMHHGRIAGEVERRNFSEELILSYATGLHSSREEPQHHG